MRLLTQTVSQVGRHAIIYGDRGVGKSSLANMLYEALDFSMLFNLVFVRVSCDLEDTFDSLWRKIFDELSMAEKVHGTNLDIPLALEEWLVSDKIAPDDVRRVSSTVDRHLVIVIDEFDQVIGNPNVALLMASTIKTLSDRRSSVTLVLVGVAENVSQLLSEHPSVERNLAQIHVSRMADTEIAQIVCEGLSSLEITIGHEMLKQVCLIASGLPAIAQLIGLQLAIAGTENHSHNVGWHEMQSAIKAAMSWLPDSHHRQWHQAIEDTESGALSENILVASAFARHDDSGWFGTPAVLEQLNKLSDNPEYGLELCSQQLHMLATSQGHIVEEQDRNGVWYFRFTEPSLQSYIVMNQIVSEKITGDLLTWDNGYPIKSLTVPSQVETPLDDSNRESETRGWEGPEGSGVKDDPGTVAFAPEAPPTQVRPLGYGNDLTRQSSSNSARRIHSQPQNPQALVHAYKVPFDLLRPTSQPSKPRNRFSLVLLWLICLALITFGSLSIIPGIATIVAANVHARLYVVIPQLSTYLHNGYVTWAPLIGLGLLATGVPILAGSIIRPKSGPFFYLLICYCCLPAIVLGVIAVFFGLRE